MRVPPKGLYAHPHRVRDTPVSSSVFVSALHVSSSQVFFFFFWTTAARTLTPRDISLVCNTPVSQSVSLWVSYIIICTYNPLQGSFVFFHNTLVLLIHLDVLLNFYQAQFIKRYCVSARKPIFFVFFYFMTFKVL